MKIKVEINEGALEHVYREIANKIEDVDREIRSTHTGKPLDAVMPVARDGFSQIGLNLPDSTLSEYSQSVSDDEDFRFVLN